MRKRNNNMKKKKKKKKKRKKNWRLIKGRRDEGKREREMKN